MKRLIYLLILNISAIPVFSQADLAKALAMKDEAIVLMDSGMIAQSIELLKEAKPLDPDNFIYDYEIAYAHYLNKEYKTSLNVYKKVVKYKNANAQCYQMLGNLYDIVGNPKKAIKAYDQGLKKFPSSGRLFLEKGNVFLNQEDYNTALDFYEQGIYADPSYPSNYYRATQLYLSSEEEVWGMIYGEIFMNLERNSKRTSEVSKWLYDTYSSEIQITSDTSYSVSFSKTNQISINLKDLKKNPEKLLASFKDNFGMMVYEPTLIKSMLNQKEINIKSLNQIRNNFISKYFSEGHHKKYPVVLFDYQKLMIELGFFEAYNHWILLEGNQDEFQAWFDSHEDEWGKFVEWYSDNPLVLGPENKFHSSQF